MLRKIGTVTAMLVVFSAVPSQADEKKMCPVQVLVPCETLKETKVPVIKAKAELVERKQCLSDKDWANCSGRWYASSKKGERSDYFFEQCGVMKRPLGHNNFSWKNSEGFHYVFRFNDERR